MINVNKQSEAKTVEVCFTRTLTCAWSSKRVHAHTKGVPGEVSDDDSDINNVFCCMLAIQSEADVFP